MSSILRTGALALAFLTCAAPVEAKGRAVCEAPRSSDHDLLMRTIIGEARTQSMQGQIAVGATILNRLRSGIFGDSVRAVVTRPRQFEPWGRRCRMLMRLNPRSPGWIEAMMAANRALADDDPTGGATHFANIDIVRKRNNQAALRWISDLTGVVRIGDHTFGRGLAGSDLDPGRRPRRQTASDDTKAAPSGLFHDQRVP